MDTRHQFTKGTLQIRHNVRLKKYCTNFDARRRIRHIRPNEALAPSSLVRQICHARKISSRTRFVINIVSHLHPAARQFCRSTYTITDNTIK
jgi:hypothetical protein